MDGQQNGSAAFYFANSAEMKSLISQHTLIGWPRGWKKEWNIPFLPAMTIPSTTGGGIKGWEPQHDKQQQMMEQLMDTVASQLCWSTGKMGIGEVVIHPDLLYNSLFTDVILCKIS